MSADPAILFLSQYYWPDVASAGQHLTDLAEALADDGFNVSVLAGRGDYRGRAFTVPSRESRNGVEIRRVGVPGFERRRGSQLGRAVDYASFHAGTLARLPMLAGRHDLVVTLTTPSLLPATVRAGCALRGGTPYSVWAMDLHPEVESTLGILPPDRPDTRFLESVSRAGYRGAKFVVTLGPHMASTIGEVKEVEASRLHTIPVWNDGEEVRPFPAEENPLRERLGYGAEDFVVMYSGNAGLAHRFDVVMEAAERIRGEEEVHFLFVGGGPRREEIEAEAVGRSLPRFRYLDYFPREQLAHSLSMGDVHLLTLRDDMAGLCAPGKLYGIMAAGRPTLMVGPRASDPGAVILEEGIGSVIEVGTRPDEAARELANEILRLRDDRAARAALGAMAREVFLARYERRDVCRQWAELVREMIDGSTGLEAASETR